LEIRRTQAFDKIYYLKKRIRLIRGGSAAGKTICILMVMINECLKSPACEMSVMASTFPMLRRGCVRDFKLVMKGIGKWRDSQWNQTILKYTFTNGSTIDFFSNENPDRIKGARRTHLFINECNVGFNFETFNQAAIRTTETIWLDWNPSQPFWVDNELIGREDVDFITLTYRDNDTLPESILNEFKVAREKAKKSEWWQQWVRVYLDGKTGRLSDSIITDWIQIPDLHKDARLLCYGLDWGYSVDSSCLVGLYKYNEGYIFDEVLYQKGMLNSHISQFLKNNNITEQIWADSAEPKSIAELQSYGHNISAVTKGKDSIMYGLSLINQNKISVTSRSKNLIKELNGYVWSTDKTGNKIQKPNPLSGDHAIDAARYAIMMQLENPNKGKYHIY
tara:strand:+ start:2097 stop:3272 length:1176 start_codon:yes stop_codon:yes gene_type:complete